MEALQYLEPMTWTAIEIAVPVIVLAILFWRSGVVRYIPNDRLGILEKLWSFRGSVSNGFIALNREAGYQPEVVRGGLHFFMPFQYSIHRANLVTIPQGQIGYVFARDGKPLPPTQTLASNTDADDFQDVRGFLEKGGQKGPQRKILREGTYAINLAQFIVLTAQSIHAVNLSPSEQNLFANMSSVISERGGFEPVVIHNAEDMIGIVTIHDGPALPDGEIIAPTVANDPNDPNFHNNFQDPEKFLNAGGYRGRQLQVLADGSYFLNRIFATVELVEKTIIDVGTVGVVVSYNGRHGADISGQAYRHGELVEVGARGVWSTPLLPGKYAFNTYAGNIVTVPTTNFVLKWTKEQFGEHRLDENLSEVSLITKDAFEPVLPLSVVVHIDYMKAPLVVQRFGDIKRLVEQTLDPMVSAYFKNIAQTKTLIQLLQERSDIQRKSGEEMREKFNSYSLELQEVLIGTPRAANDQNSIEQILIQLRDRQIAVEKVETYKLQERAATQERTLREKEALAEQQAKITTSALTIEISENEGKAQLARTRQEAETIQVNAKAEAEKVRLAGQGEADMIKAVALADAERIKATGFAEAEKVRAVGLAEAEATEKKVAAFGGPDYQLNSQVLMRFAEAIENGKLPLVPQIQIGATGGEKGGANGLVEMMLSMLVADRVGRQNLPDEIPAPVEED
ncbi:MULTISPECIES: flotillin family protein [unclassified Mesorhizobium]|uniref:SPFH domain-containing protein n=1 Tax=unclassified Mesorhizobium TaxID=325217 RepID=UPI000FCBC932|nr:MULTISPECIES: flotillin family protein [unclassified Mesorhizobium]RUW19225.1 flotillin family protein [Mesorhizobium sp. M4B.F.Ca.ET.013.02.1.1]RVD24935.1 flotillin family protein [Mesorhizobium sp. M4B.F.Ca.ET.017.02.2.1]RWC92820.1 MAG: flotillin family protein [Mesorhizobium sp.]RWF42402.1 MAG: flotillin family protein [Mesorhizobium sp.]RWF63388.1 MAG: flotillin family protein [Mesorhizobium sp.]